jgi:hypothetical protein
MPGPYYSEDPGLIWIGLLVFLGLGLLLVAKGLQVNSLVLTSLGAVMLFGFVYYSILWFKQKR